MNPCLRYKKDGDEYTLTDTYTDDIFEASKTNREVEKRKDKMDKEWEIKDVEDNKYFLGIHVQHDIG